MHMFVTIVVLVVWLTQMASSYMLARDIYMLARDRVTKEFYNRRHRTRCHCLMSFRSFDNLDSVSWEYKFPKLKLRGLECFPLLFLLFEFFQSRVGHIFLISWLVFMHIIHIAAYFEILSLDVQKGTSI